MQRLQRVMQDTGGLGSRSTVWLAILMGPSAHAAMSGLERATWAAVGATQDTPPAFRGVPRTGARDAPYRAMATDQRPRGTGPGGAIMAYDTAAIEDVAGVVVRDRRLGLRRRLRSAFLARWAV